MSAVWATSHASCVWTSGPQDARMKSPFRPDTGHFIYEEAAPRSGSLITRGWPIQYSFSWAGASGANALPRITPVYMRYPWSLLLQNFLPSALTSRGLQFRCLMNTFPRRKSSSSRVPAVSDTQTSDPFSVLVNSRASVIFDSALPGDMPIAVHTKFSFHIHI